MLNITPEVDAILERVAKLRAEGSSWNAVVGDIELVKWLSARTDEEIAEFAQKRTPPALLEAKPQS